MIIAGVNTLDAKVISALQGYIAGGGTVIVTDDSQVQIPGAVKLGVPCTTKQYDLCTSFGRITSRTSRWQRAMPAIS